MYIAFACYLLSTSQVAALISVDRLRNATTQTAAARYPRTGINAWIDATATTDGATYWLFEAGHCRGLDTTIARSW